MLLQFTRKHLQGMNEGLEIPMVENPSLESQELLCYCTNQNKTQFFLHLQEEVKAEVQEQVEALLKRRETGEPIAYLLGEWDFYGKTFELTPDVLIPRLDTEVLVQKAVTRSGQLGGRILDLCAGSGCIGITIANLSKVEQVILGEISPKAREICKKNIKRHNLEGSVICEDIDALAPPEHEGFSVIVCNPPYIPTKEIPTLSPMVRDFEPHLALDGGEDGLDFYRAITKNWSSTLVEGGYFLFEVGIYQSKAVSQMLKNEGFIQVEITYDTQKIGRVVEGRKPIETNIETN